MDALRDPPVDELASLRACVNDLASLTSLPARWTNGEQRDVVDTSLDALLEMLQLDFACVLPNDSVDGRSHEMVRVGDSLVNSATAQEIRRAIGTYRVASPATWPARTHMSFGDLELSVSFVPVGLRGEIGVVGAGSRRPSFPTQTETLMLDVAASQLAVGVQHARLPREIERNSRLLIDSIPGLVALLTTGGEVEFVNRLILDYTGGSLAEMKQWGTNGIVHPDDIPYVIQTFTQSIASGSPYEIVQRLRRSDGDYLWFQNNGFPIRDASGHIVRWCVLLTDVDERMRVEDALAASERNLQLMVDTIPALAWSTLPDGTTDFFNQHYLDFIGLSEEQASGWGWTAAVHPEDMNDLAETWQRIMASAAPGEAEARLRRQDGEYRWFLFRANPLRDETGAIVRWYGVNTDIEDRKRAEVELRRAYDSFADAQRLSKTGSFITDLVGDDHNWSEETYLIFGFDPASKVTLQRIQDIIHPDDFPTFGAMIARAMTGENVNFAFRIKTSSGVLKHIRGAAHVIEQVEGRPMFVGALQDVTESVLAEGALSKARSELAHVSSMTTLSALTASIAHEVNQPLSGIITNAGTCLRMLDDTPPNVEGARETARRTIRDGNRAAEVIARLRSLFSKKEFTLEPMELNDALREVIALSSSDIQRSRVVLQTEFSPDIPSIIGDRIQLQQVVMNLLRNASDAMADVHDRPRTLLLRTERNNDGHVVVTVRDSGVGIDPETLEKLFNAFYTTKSSGMGVGLFVCRSIVERHHGRLWAEPNDGGPGATFAFSIPLNPEGVPDPAFATSAA